MAFMFSNYGKGPRARGKEIVFVFLGILIFASACTKPRSDPYLKIIINPPVTLNPRHAIDASGQRLGALLFRSLAQIAPDLTLEPDLASQWKTSADGKIIEFKIDTALTDQKGAPIDARSIAQCLENYRAGKPSYTLKGAFPNWVGTEARGNSVQVHLSQADPYFVKNATLLRFFRVEGNPSPCAEPNSDQTLISSGRYFTKTWNSAPEDEIKLEGPRPIEFLFVPDDNTKLLKLMRGEADGIFTALSLAKTRWAQKHLSDRFQVLEQTGLSVSYLAFNLKNPILAQKKVREALAHAIPREAIIRDKMLNFGSLATSLLSPVLAESSPHEFKYDPAWSERLLDEAGYPKQANGTRLTLRYKTTPVREGLETALIFQDVFAKIGVKLVLDVVETAVFFATVKKGAFDLYSSRWLGVSDGSILYRTLDSKSFDNRVHYENPQMDQLLESAMKENRLELRKKTLAQVQAKLYEDLPYFPLWYWNNALIIARKFRGLEARELSLIEGLEPLTHLR